MFEKSIDDLKTKGIEEKSIQMGDKMPGFSLPNAMGNIRSVAGYCLSVTGFCITLLSEFRD